jgi:hypothetical protein
MMAALIGQKLQTPNTNIQGNLKLQALNAGVDGPRLEGWVLLRLGER